MPEVVSHLFLSSQRGEIDGGAETREVKNANRAHDTMVTAKGLLWWWGPVDGDWHLATTAEERTQFPAWSSPVQQCVPGAGQDQLSFVAGPQCSSLPQNRLPGCPGFGRNTSHKPCRQRWAQAGLPQVATQHGGPPVHSSGEGFRSISLAVTRRKKLVDDRATPSLIGSGSWPIGCEGYQQRPDVADARFAMWASWMLSLDPRQRASRMFHAFLHRYSASDSPNGLSTSTPANA